ncbi:MAG: 50S ribosomal protein L2 [Legionellales bacterium]|mgnify:CR=1 FL=1|nr:50S ribosomal protein L2 [Legionellales bacterium]OUX64312.1 MAG: 50S ribosomal protein L2 [Gammaproteobacteria bacterium TMED281]
MTIIQKAKPTSPGRRHVVSIKHDHLAKSKPMKKLTKAKVKIDGRNNKGQITVRHRGGGHKKLYRLVDFKRQMDGIKATVRKIEYDPNRSAHIALICYENGKWSYVIAAAGLSIGDTIYNGPDSPIKPGNFIPLNKVPQGTIISCIEIAPLGGAKLARSAGSYANLVSKDHQYALVKLRSGEVRKIHIDSRVMIGSVSNEKHSLKELGKAGAKRWRGIRPTVRGVAMNPIDHPHGGGEGRTSGGRPAVSPTGVKAKGKKTRHNKRTDKMIVTRRKKRD